MIAFAKDFIDTLRRPRIRMAVPDRMLLYTGARREKIDAHFSADNRIRQLIVHTRTGTKAVYDMHYGPDFDRS